MDAFGHLATPGRTSSIAVNRLARFKLGHPYSSCSNTGGTQKNYYPNAYGTYEYESCIRSCLQDAIIKECGCYDPQLFYPNSSSSCYKSSDPSSASEWVSEAIHAISELCQRAGQHEHGKQFVQL